MLPSKNSLFTYQPILDRHGRIVALSVLYQAVEDQEPDDVTQATARIVTHAHLDPAVIDLLGVRKIFVRVDEEFLSSGMISMLPPQQTILELVLKGPVTSEILALCSGFKKMGYSFAFNEEASAPEMAVLLDRVDIVKLNIAAFSLAQLADRVKVLKRDSHTLLAWNVLNQQDFEACATLGFDLYQGHFFAHPNGLVAKQTDPRRTHILRILALIEQEADDKVLEFALKHNPELTLHLLRLVNSPAFALQTHIGSMREIVNIFGRSKLAQWLQVLLFVSREEDHVAGWALFELAVKRGRMVEALMQGLTHQPGGSRQDKGFMVGLLSLADVLLGLPMEEVLPGMGVAREIQEAIGVRSGILGTLLQLCEALENADFEAVKVLSAESGIALMRVMEVQREATLWAGVVAKNTAANSEGY